MSDIFYCNNIKFIFKRPINCVIECVEFLKYLFGKYSRLKSAARGRSDL